MPALPSGLRSTSSSAATPTSRTTASSTPRGRAGGASSTSTAAPGWSGPPASSRSTPAASPSTVVPDTASDDPRLAKDPALDQPARAERRPPGGPDHPPRNSGVWFARLFEGLSTPDLGGPGGRRGGADLRRPTACGHRSGGCNVISYLAAGRARTHPGRRPQPRPPARWAESGGGAPPGRRAAFRRLFRGPWVGTTSPSTPAWRQP